MSHEQDEDGAEGRRRQARRGPQSDRGEDGATRLARGEQGGGGGGERGGGGSIGALTREKRQPRKMRVAVGVVQLQGRVVGPPRPLESAGDFRLAPFVGGRAGEIGKTLDSDSLRGLLQFRKAGRGAADVVLEVGV